MGMYTGLRGTVVIKEHLRERLEVALYEKHSWKALGYISEAFTKFASQGRAQFIPFGVVCYMPDDWEEGNQYDKVTGILSFCCSLKNYQGELESLYEGYDTPTKYRSGT